jgi:hypothetical protein
VNYELTGVQTPTLKTNGVVSQSDLTWDPIHPGTTVDFTNGLPLEFGFCDNAALGTTATSTSRGPILDNFLVEITAPAVPGNQPPVLAPLADRVLGAGQTLWVTNSATDPEVPPQSLVYTLLGAPAGADIQTHSGLVQWRPGVAQGGAVYPVTVRVADNGTPSLSATQSFSVTVTAALAPALSAAAWSGGQFGMTIGGSAGPDYSVLASTNLTDWSVVFSTNPPTVPFPWVDPDSSLQPLRFYQVEIGP